jgi:hypothetical protein|tara:strand:- start:2770 stop:3072 length:303 start_codon:yes stop_codon:yes gene_type:complete
MKNYYEKQLLKTAKVRIVQMDVDDPAFKDNEINEDKLYKIYLYQEVMAGTHEHDYDVHEEVISELTVTRRILSHLHPEIDIELMISHPDYESFVESHNGN